MQFPLLHHGFDMRGMRYEKKYTYIYIYMYIHLYVYINCIYIVELHVNKCHQVLDAKCSLKYTHMHTMQGNLPSSKNTFSLKQLYNLKHSATSLGDNMNIPEVAFGTSSYLVSYSHLFLGITLDPSFSRPRRTVQVSTRWGPIIHKVGWIQ